MGSKIFPMCVFTESVIDVFLPYVHVCLSVALLFKGRVCVCARALSTWFCPLE